MQGMYQKFPFMVVLVSIDSDCIFEKIFPKMFSKSF